MKIGWSPYDVKPGFGWSGPNVGKSDIMRYTYLADAPVTDLQRSIIYDDYGRTDAFAFDIENGKYAVTVSIGWQGKTYSKQRGVVEGKVLFDDAETNPAAPYKVQTIDVDVTDGNVTLEARRWRTGSCARSSRFPISSWLRVTGTSRTALPSPIASRVSRRRRHR
jgi:hypothetical protein